MELVTRLSGTSALSAPTPWHGGVALRAAQEIVSAEAYPPAAPASAKPGAPWPLRRGSATTWARGGHGPRRALAPALPPGPGRRPSNRRPARGEAGRRATHGRSGGTGAPPRSGSRPERGVCALRFRTAVVD